MRETLDSMASWPAQRISTPSHRRTEFDIRCKRVTVPSKGFLAAVSRTY
jgi:hypothetical protein